MVPYQRAMKKDNLNELPLQSVSACCCRELGVQEALTSVLNWAGHFGGQNEGLNGASASASGVLVA